MDTVHNRIADELVNFGYSISPDFLSNDVVLAMKQELHGLQRHHLLRKAGVGQGAERTDNTKVRGDFIYWIEHDSDDMACRPYLDQLFALQRTLNRTLMLGLSDFEGHYASYPPGAFYKKHLDQFQHDKHRTVTCILYLNHDWLPDDGGQLRIFLNDNESFLDVAPSAGKLVTFMSDRFWHEVLPANRDRLSLTGWFKTRSNLPG